MLSIYEGYLRASPLCGVSVVSVAHSTAGRPVRRGSASIVTELPNNLLRVVQ